MQRIKLSNITPGNKKINISNEELIKLNKVKSISEIAKSLNVSYQALSQHFKVNDMPIRKVDRTTIKMPKQYEYNENYFENIDNEHKAYWLGFIMADGCLIKKHKNRNGLTLSINLMSSDNLHLQKLIDDVGGNLRITYGKNPGSKFISDGKEVSIRPSKFCRLDINSKKLCNDLINH